MVAVVRGVVVVECGRRLTRWAASRNLSGAEARDAGEDPNTSEEASFSEEGFYILLECLDKVVLSWTG